MTAPAHPQRCETCTKTKCNLHPDNAPPPEAPLRTIEYVEMAREDISSLGKGCASHSSVQSRDQVLDTLRKIEEYINSNAPWLPGTDDRVVDARKLVAYIRVLMRQQGSREQEAQR